MNSGNASRTVDYPKSVWEVGSSSSQGQGSGTHIAQLRGASPRDPALMFGKTSNAGRLELVKNLQPKSAKQQYGGILMTCEQMTAIGPSKPECCFSSGSRAYNQILEQLDTCNQLYQDSFGSQNRAPSIPLEELSKLQSMCSKYIARIGANSERKRAVEALSKKIIKAFVPPGSPYLTVMEDGQVDFTCLNNRVQFASNDLEIRNNKISSSHIALQEIVDRQNEDHGQAVVMSDHRADRRAQQRGTPQLMARHMDPQLEKRFHELVSGASENFAVDHAKWGEFFSRELSNMPVGSTRYMLLRSGLHVMAVRLLVKQGPQGQPRYAINFHDPSKTLTDKRVFADTPEQLKSLGIESFLDDGPIAEYYGNPDTSNCERVSLFQVVPDDFYARPLADPRDYGPAENRSVQLFLPEQQGAPANLACHLMRANLPLDEVKAQVENCDPQHVFPLLAAQGAAGVPALFAGMACGNADKIQDFGRILLDARQENLISNDQLFSLLEAKNTGGVSGLTHALQEGRTDVVKGFCQVLSEARQCNYISSDQLAYLLEAKRPDMVGGLYLAFHQGHADTVKAFCQELLEARQNNHISDDQLAHLLEAKQANGMMGFQAAIKNGHVDAVKAFYQVLPEARQNNYISDVQVFNLLGARDVGGTPGLYYEMQEGYTAAVEAFADVLDAVTRQGNPFGNDQLFNLLKAMRTDGKPGLYYALFKGHGDAIRAYGQMLLTARQRGCINDEQLFNLLGARSTDTNVPPGLWFASQNGRADAISAYGQILLEAHQSNRISNGQLFELLEAKNPVGGRGLNIAQHQGNTDTIRAFGQILLEARQSNRISNDQLFELLEATRGDGTPGLMLAMYSGHAGAISAFGQILMEARQNNWVNDQQLVRLLAAKDADGASGLFVALQFGHAGAIQALTRVIEPLAPTLANAKQNNRISGNQLMNMLDTRLPNNFSGVIMAQFLNHDNAIRAYRNLLSKAGQNNLISASQVSELGASIPQSMIAGRDEYGLYINI